MLEPAGTKVLDKLLDEIETAAHMGVRTQTLAAWRCNKRYDLPYVKVGRSVRYRLSDIEAFLESRTITSSN